MSDPSRHARERGAIESILRRIPGFQGYLEQEYRRESDYLTRTWMADRLQASKRRLDDYMRNLVDQGQLDALTLCERLRTRLDGAISRIRGEVRGYSGLFDYVQVNEKLLEEVYDYDLALVDQVDDLADAIEKLPQTSEPPSAVVPDLLRRLGEIEEKFAHRADLLKGLGPEQPS
ncbi:MAG: hypothetical protein KY475_21735 [Planctomycetes bacterium]|nr:hypothetical protein [Planctomycetota bacterium]